MPSKSTLVWLPSSKIVFLRIGNLCSSVYTALHMLLAARSVRAHLKNGVIALLAVLASVTATAADLTVGPEDYRVSLRSLQPGDTLRLRAGVYTDGLPIGYLNGTQEAPIVITGPNIGAPAIFLARRAHNTVSIVNSSYVTIRHLTLDGQSLPVDGVKAEGYSDWAHHIVLEDLVIKGHGYGQQTVAISTKCPAWEWVLRRNVILGAGTGIYLGDSDGTDPFFAGLIEHNLIVDTLGYNLQIKHQNGRILQERPVTIIRHNMFSKAHNTSLPPKARPNVLVGHWPGNGPGAGDHYEIYGNLFYQNPHEALFQGEGNLALYNNLFVNEYGDAIHIQPHNDIPKTIDIFFNTVLARDKGIVIQEAKGGATSFQQNVGSNAVFAEVPLTGGSQMFNTVGSMSDAEKYLVQPHGRLGEFDLRPRQGLLHGHLLDPSRPGRYGNWRRDFDGHHRNLTTRGAYGNDNSSPGWHPLLERKPVTEP